MKIVLVGPVYPYRGGIAHYTTKLWRTLRDRGHDVLVVSFKRQYPQWLFPGRSDKDPSASPLNVEGANYWLDSLNPITWLVTFWRIRRHSPDVLVLQWWTSFWAPVWFALGGMAHFLLPSSIVYICHNVLPHEIRPYDRWLAKLAWHWGQRFIVQSAAEERELSALRPNVKVDIAPHPVYDMFVDQQVTRQEARRQLGLPIDIPLLLFFGIVREYKGLEELLRALPKVQAAGSRAVLVVAGEFWEDKGFYLELIREMGIDQSVVIEDRYIPNEEVALYFSAADVLVAPYRRPTGSGVVQMARAFGLPTVTTVESQESRSRRQEWVQVPPGDVSALAAAVLRVLKGHRIALRDASGTEHHGDSWNRLADLIEGVD